MGDNPHKLPIFGSFFLGFAFCDWSFWWETKGCLADILRRAQAPILVAAGVGCLGELFAVRR